MDKNKSQNQEVYNMTSYSNINAFKKEFIMKNDVYGEFIPLNKKDNKSKELGNYSTKKGEITTPLINEHLEGIKGLGIIPINNHHMSKIGIIDVDTYNNREYLHSIIDLIYKYNMPLLPFESKSGGLHLYLFLDQEIKAGKIREYLNSFLLVLGLPKDTEIFPKQSIREGSGSFINLPFFGDKRLLFRKDYSSCRTTEALDTIKNKKVTEDQLKILFQDLPLSDAPPCLQSIYLRNDTQFRNNYLFSLGVYYKSKYGDDFENYLAEANSRLTNSIPLNELNKTILSQHRKKDYSYKCSDSPLNDLCKKSECSKRSFGLGSSNISELSFGQLTQYLSDPPTYSWDINDKKLVFDTELEVMKQEKFREQCFRLLSILPNKLTCAKWTNIINTALKNVQKIEVEDELSIGSNFIRLLVDFLEYRVHGSLMEHILIGSIYKDEKLKKYIFKIDYLIKFFESQNFKSFTLPEIARRLKKMGCESKRCYIPKSKQGKGFNTRAWLMPFEAIEKYINDEEEAPEIEFKTADLYSEEVY